MKKDFNLSLTPEQAADEIFIRKQVAARLGLKYGDISTIQISRRSVDARQRQVKINLGLSVFVGEQPSPEPEKINYESVESKTPVGIVGAGPAGLFAALRLIELGYKPVLFERGKPVDERKRDIASLYRDQVVNPDSNYGFGEGGAGTFSDGKLYSRSTKRGDIRRILNLFVQFGASPDILIDVHPHIGTDRLPAVIRQLREQIIASGGEVHFNSRVTDLIVKEDCCRGVVLKNGQKMELEALILATGHSARDVYEMLHLRAIELEAKSFAVGVRIEHPQALIDSIRYHRKDRGPYLPAAEYAFAEQVNGRGVYSFCMCPGGFVVPASTAPGEMVVNGMSPSRRNSPFANSGLVVEVHPEDLPGYAADGVFSGLQFQREMEHLCYELNGHSQLAPAQRVGDFISNRNSQNFPDSSFRPGLIAANLGKEFPDLIASRLKQGILQIDAKAKGFLTEEAIVMGVESRTSSPLRVPRDKISLEHIHIRRLFPGGEGAGYAGGIVSSAMDGEHCAEAVARLLK